jgi:hypothetical protein
MVMPTARRPLLALWQQAYHARIGVVKHKMHRNAFIFAANGSF